MHRIELHIWMLRLAAGLLSRLVADDMSAAKLGTTKVILIAAFKTNLMPAYFKKLKSQPRPCRFILSSWLSGATAIIVGGFRAV